MRAHINLYYARIAVILTRRFETILNRSVYIGCFMHENHKNTKTRIKTKPQKSRSPNVTGSRIYVIRIVNEEDCDLIIVVRSPYTYYVGSSRSFG